jgi:serine/threonine-protein kinase RsbW
VDPNRNQLTIRGYFKNLARIGEFVGEAARRAGLDDRAVYAVKMAVDEACTNIIEHAYGGEGRGQIRLIYQIQGDGLQIVIYDHGKPFSPTNVPEFDIAAPLEARQSGGMGMFFIRSLMDQVEFKFGTPAGNQLTLFKRRESLS